MEQPFEINILGTRFAIRTDQSPQHMEKVLSTYTRKVEEIMKKTGVQDSLKIAILAGLVLADELLHEQAESPSPHDEELERLTSRILLQINEALE
ncbi:hypothetical protein Spith_1389 [Spirochaeta thermophila DSM 6578]|uniref:Cell division protein ZapA n=1 Tax=Winmispira thermophila (strain ATCC 700085 / DSM 6578 / Z-1203) TaxID=869211 RepID=G0GFW0_WINT7|nr:cell division protein ZapA [Spirochaeta thermophila]AEJ61653.1 hypothetical protein Spith_1389 [Spirochaeta thermophila DSM 6578]